MVLKREERASAGKARRPKAEEREEPTAIGGIPGISELMYMAMESWRKSQYSCSEEAREKKRSARVVNDQT